MGYCNADNCRKQADYGFEYRKGLKCNLHREDGMLNVSRKRCEKCLITIANYGYEKYKATHCASCKEEGMFDVKSSRCNMCNKHLAIFGVKGNKPSRCASCKEENMTDLKNKKCVTCKELIPTFGLERTATHCKNCKTSDMTDLKHKICNICNKTRALYGYEAKKGLRCGECKESDMINVITIMCCICNKIQPSYGLEKGKTATHCTSCKTSDMINVVSKMCKTENCQTQANVAVYKGYCAWCYANLYPDSPVVKNHKTKERKVVDFIRESFPLLDWKFDTIIANGTSMRRPDIFLKCDEYYIIIEVDENQHKYYDCTCENKRLMQLSKDVNHKPIVLIRFNPDSYINKENKKVKSCFSINKETGLQKIDDYSMWIERLEVLKETIQYRLNNRTDKLVEPIELFYNLN